MGRPSLKRRRVGLQGTGGMEGMGSQGRAKLAVAVV